MKSLLIVNDFPPILGGQSNYYFNLSHAFPNGEVVILAPVCEGYEDFDQAQNLNILRREYLFTIPILEKICKIVLPFFYSIPIIFREKIECVHCGHVLSTGIIGLVLKKLLKKPYIVYTHSADILAYQKFLPIKWLLKCILKNAFKVVCNSHYTKGKLLELGVDEKKIRLLYPKVDVKAFGRNVDTSDVVDRYGLRNKKVILSVNRLVERKGNDIMIDAMASILLEVPDAVYLIVGRGPYERQLRGMVDQYDLDMQVIFLGSVDHEEVFKLYKSCDVFVMLSRNIQEEDVEGFGFVFLEANACGKPVVAGRSGGVVEAVEDGCSGILVDPLDVQAAADAVIALLQDQPRAVQLGEQGRKRAIASFDLHLFKDEVMELMQGL